MPRTNLIGAMSLAAVLAGASLASAATTAWTNPDGGLWTNTANWSNGVPTAGDVAILPGFPGDAGYSVQITGAITAGVLQIGGGGADVRLIGAGTLTAVGGCYVGLSGAAALRLEGPTLAVAGPTSVGGPGGDSTLAVTAGSTFSTSQLTVAGGPGSAAGLVVEDEGSVLFAGSVATLGSTGAAQITVTEGATLAAASLTFGPQAFTNITLTEGSVAPIQLLGPLKRGGVLVVDLDAGYTPVAHAQLPIISTSAPMTSQWSSTLMPFVFDEQATLVTTALGEMVEIPDPFVELVVDPPEIVVSVGFTAEFNVYRRRLSGIQELLCCDGPPDEPINVHQAGFGTPRFEVVSQFPLAILGLEVGTVQLVATWLSAHPDLTGTAMVTIEALPTSFVRRVNETALGTESTVDTPNLSPPLTFNTLRVSPDGRFVLFSSCAPEFLPSLTAGPCQLYLKDLVTGTLELVSLGPTGDPASGGATIGADMSADARFVVFSMAAPNFLPEAPNAQAQIWLRDRLVGTTELVTGELGSPFLSYGNAGSYVPRITPDGHFVVYATDATNLAGFDNNGMKRDIIRWDRLTDTAIMVSRASDDSSLNLPSNHPDCSDDGRFIAFSTAATDTGPRGLTALTRVYVKDLVTGVLSLESVATDGTLANGVSDRPSLDASGERLAFDSLATNLGPGALSAGRVWFRDRTAQTTTIVDVASDPEGLSGTASAPCLTPDGRFVALVAKPTAAPDFPLLDTGVFRVDRLTGQVLRVARTAPSQGSGTLLVDCYAGTAISDDGRTQLFATDATGLVSFDTNGTLDIFVTTINDLFGDLDGDSMVGPADLASLLGLWGQPSAAADLDGDGIVGAGDLALLLGAWGS
jgi:hypothetical protein